MTKRLLAAGTLVLVLGACKDSPITPPVGPTDITVPALSIGQAYAVPNEVASMRIGGEGGGAEYTLVPVLASTTASRTASLQITASGVQGVSSTPNPSLGAGWTPAQAAHSGVGGAGEFKRRLRELERRELTPRLRDERGAREGAFDAGRSIGVASVPAVGTLQQYNVRAAPGDPDAACGTPDYRTGRVVAVSQRAIIVADTANPRGTGTFSNAEYLEFANTFDRFVWPALTGHFGEPQDIDANQRVVIFFTRAVNELTPRNQEWYVGGFFFARDLFPRTAQPGFSACAGSNVSEMFYMLVPDPQGVVNGNVRLKERELSRTVAVLGHEFQHLINASRRLYVVQARTNWAEETWLNEGLSHVAEELLGYAASSLAPQQNIDADRLVNSQEASDAFFAYQSSNVGLLARFLQRPDTTSLIGSDGLATRGATWSFLRYAADRRLSTPSQEPGFWRGMVDSNNIGFANLRAALGSEPLDWINDWLVSLYTDDALRGVDPQYTQPSWNLRSIYPRLRDSQNRQIYPVYPLTTQTLSNGSNTVSLRAASAAYLRFGVAAGATADLNIGGGTNVRYTLVRTR